MGPIWVSDVATTCSRRVMYNTSYTINKENTKIPNLYTHSSETCNRLNFSNFVMIDCSWYSLIG